MSARIAVRYPQFTNLFAGDTVRTLQITTLQGSKRLRPPPFHTTYPYSNLREEGPLSILGYELEESNFTV